MNPQDRAQLLPDVPEGAERYLVTLGQSIWIAGISAARWNTFSMHEALCALREKRGARVDVMLAAFDVRACESDVTLLAVRSHPLMDAVQQRYRERILHPLRHPIRR